MSAVLYILRNAEGKYYVGATRDLIRRLSEHNRGQARSTRGKGCWILVYTEEYPTFVEAHARERHIKRKRRKSYIEWLISESNKRITHGCVV